MNNLRRLIVIASFLMLVLGGSILHADVRSDYDAYVAAYNAYRNAVIEKVPQAQLEGLLAEFKAAKAVYEGNLSKPTENVDTSDIDTNSAEESYNGEAQATSTGEGQTKKVVKKIQLPDQLKKILQAVWSDKNRKSPDSAMKLLAKYIDENPDSKFADLAKYELAKAHELLKDDVETAEKVLSTIGAKNPNSKIAIAAKERIKYLEAGKKHKQWKNALNGTYNTSQESYSKYRNTSWLAFPVKVTRWVGYASKLFKFNNTQGDFEKFQIWYEDMGSRFAPPVEITFDKFVTSYSNGSDTSEVSLHYQNSKAWYSRWRILEDARHSIDIQYFIVDKDAFGMSMLGMLLKKAQQGLKIRLMMDARGTKNLTRKLLGQDYLQELMEYPNVEVKVFNPVHTNLLTAITDLRRLMASNHDKIVVVDGEYSVVGGRNVSRDYYLDKPDHPGAYRDCDVVIKDHAIAEQLSFAFDEEFTKLKTFGISKELWGNIDVMSDDLNAAYEAMGAHLINETYIPPSGSNKKFANAVKKWNAELAEYKNLRDFSGFDPFANSYDAPVKIIDKHSIGGPRNDITDQMVKYIDGCRKEVVIQNPYVVLTERIFGALKRAGARGIPIIMHTNSPFSTDSLATQAMFYADWKRVLKEIPTARIYVYDGEGKLHAKTWVFDRKIGVVGTYNLDYMSEQINSEVVAAIKDNGFAKELREGIMHDVSISKLYKIDIDANGEVQSVYGPDDLPGKNFWLLKLLSKFTIFKKLI